jgi:starch phosphorylase
MKVVPNGGLNISVLDGWWAEAYNQKNGWAIGRGEEYDDQGYQDEVESHSLYNILEKEVIPTFYNRGADQLPREWISRIKESMKTICPQFNTNRMVRDYTEKFYLSAHKNQRRFSENKYSARASSAAGSGGSPNHGAKSRSSAWSLTNRKRSRWGRACASGRR